MKWNEIAPDWYLIWEVKDLWGFFLIAAYFWYYSLYIFPFNIDVSAMKTSILFEIEL